MPTWLIPILVRLLAQAITAENVKGLEKEILMIVERAVKGNALEVQLVAALASALGIQLDPV